MQAETTSKQPFFCLSEGSVEGGNPMVQIILCFSMSLLACLPMKDRDTKQKAFHWSQPIK